MIVTDHAILSATIGHTYLRSTALWSKNSRTLKVFENSFNYKMQSLKIALVNSTSLSASLVYIYIYMTGCAVQP